MHDDTMACWMVVAAALIASSVAFKQLRHGEVGVERVYFLLGTYWGTCLFCLYLIGRCGFINDGAYGFLVFVPTVWIWSWVPCGLAGLALGSVVRRWGQQRRLVVLGCGKHGGMIAEQNGLRSPRLLPADSEVIGKMLIAGSVLWLPAVYCCLQSICMAVMGWAK